MSAKLIERSTGTTVVCPAPSGRPSGKSPVAARPPSSGSVVCSVLSVKPKALGLLTSSQSVTPAPPNGLFSESGEKRISLA